MIKVIGGAVFATMMGSLVSSGIQQENKKQKKIVYVKDDDYWIKRDTPRQKEIRKILKEKWDKLPYFRMGAGTEKVGTSNFDKPFEYSKKKDGDLLERRIKLAKNEIKNIWKKRKNETIPWTSNERTTEDITNAYGQTIGTKFITTTTISQQSIGMFHFDNYVWEHRPLIKEYWEIELKKHNEEIPKPESFVRTD